MNAQPVHSIRIVAAPDLRRIIQHSGIKPPAAAAASLYQHIRIPPCQLFEKIIYAEHIIISHFSRKIGRRIHLRNAAVHIPLNVFDISLI